MFKIRLSIAVICIVASGFSAKAQDFYRSYDYRPDVGGHSRHMHRDWSEQAGRHVPNACWEWDVALGWVWICH